MCKFNCVLSVTAALRIRDIVTISYLFILMLRFYFRNFLLCTLVPLLCDIFVFVTHFKLHFNA